ncbi:MAG: rRNA (guanosine2251-2-O)-methyltransferase, partial [Micromonosporaceae bacterium]
MPGSSQRGGARRTSSKKGASVGSGGKRRAGLKGKGRTLPADERPWHKAYSGDEPLPERTAWKQEKERRAAAAQGRAPKVGQPGKKQTSKGTGNRSGPRVAPGRKAAPAKDAPELLVGRNPVAEALRGHISATAIYVAQGIDLDDRVKEAVRVASDRGIPLLEVSRSELDRMTGGVLHQGIGLQVPPFAYEPFDDLLAAASEQVAPLLIALDGVTDPRNLGAIIRSAAAFDAHGVVVPQRRAVGMTGSAWRTSAGAAARLRVARATNLARTLGGYQDAGLQTVGLAADADMSIHDYDGFTDPIALVVGAEGAG